MKWLLPPILFLVCLGLMVLLRWCWPLAVVVPYPYRYGGVGLMLLGVLTGSAGALTFLKARTNIHPFHEADQLVTSGPFRFSRNPMYLGLLLNLVGIGLLLGAVSPVLGPLAFLATADRWYIAGEERMLKRKFGPAFAAYRQRVRRWI